MRPDECDPGAHIDYVGEGALEAAAELKNVAQARGRLAERRDGLLHGNAPLS
jgi:hypothetical protein